MKPTLRLTIAAFVLAALNLSTTVVQAQFSYTTNNCTITITGYTGPGDTVTIPNEISGLAVSSIRDYALSDCTSLTSIAITGSLHRHHVAVAETTTTKTCV